MYAVNVFDNTCNVIGHEEGIYGANDYRWMNEPLNGGNGEYSINTREEAEAVMADFQKVAEENSIEWASFGIDEIEIPVAEMEKIKDLRDILKKAIEVMQAFCDGNTVQLKLKSQSQEEWVDMDINCIPCWDWVMNDYRIKPKKKVRPYTYEEMCDAVKKHGFIIKSKSEKRTLFICGFDEEDVNFQDVTYKTYEDLMENIWLDDNSPCCIIEEE